MTLSAVLYADAAQGGRKSRAFQGRSPRRCEVARAWVQLKVKRKTFPVKYPMKSGLEVSKSFCIATIGENKMKYFIDAFMNAQNKIILIDIFGSKKACAHHKPALLTVTTEVAMSSVAIYFEEKVWRVEVNFKSAYNEIATVLHELTRSVKIPDDLRAAAIDALEKKIPRTLRN